MSQTPIIPPGSLLDKERGIVRRVGSVSDYIKQQISRLSTNIKVIFKDESGVPLASALLSYDLPAKSVHERFVNDVEVFLPDYNRLLDEENLDQPLWSIGFYDGIDVLIIPKDSKSRPIFVNQIVAPNTSQKDGESSMDKLEIVSSIPEVSTDPMAGETLKKLVSPVSEPPLRGLQDSDIPADSENLPIGQQKASISSDTRKSPVKLSVRKSPSESTSLSLDSKSNYHDEEEVIVDSSAEEYTFETPSKPTIAKSNQLFQSLGQPLTSVVTRPPPFPKPPSMKTTSTKLPNESSSSALSTGPKQFAPQVYHFIVKGPHVKVFDIKENETFAIIFASYENASQGKRPQLKLGSKLINRDDTPSSVNAALGRQNILQVTMVEIQDKVKISLINTDGTLKPLYFNVKRSVKLKKLFKKYSSQCGIDLSKLEFSFNGEKITNDPNFVALQDLKLREDSGTTLHVTIRK